MGGRTAFFTSEKVLEGARWFVVSVSLGFLTWGNVKRAFAEVMWTLVKIERTFVFVNGILQRSIGLFLNVNELLRSSRGRKRMTDK